MGAGMVGNAADGYALGVDVGGTFTDVVLAGATGQVAVAKTLTTHDDPAAGILTGVRSALDKAEVRPGQVTRFVHATTLATNLILERQGVQVAHIGTKGFRSMLPLGRYARVEEDRFDIFFDPPLPPIPAADCFEVPERLNPRGEVLVPLDEQAAREVAEQIRDRGITAVSIALLHSYANPDHEDRTAQIVRDVLPAGSTVVTSAQIWPELREYERSTTTLMSAYVGPIMVSYLSRLQERLAGAGITATVQVMESGGGVMSADMAGSHAVATIESGPAAGVLAARATGLAAGHRDVISFDMGGTTAKASVIRDGQPSITTEFHVGGKGSFGGRRAGTGVPIKTPAIDLAEVGAGGGSIAWVDEGGALRVGPQSAGSQPGPACYGLGGSEPTVTDANLVLGYLDPDTFAASTMTLSTALAEKAIDDRLAGPLGVSRAEAANAVHEIANATMGAAFRVVTVQRGLDPRGFAVVASGGAGPMHAARVAERFEISTVIIPPSCGVGSAVGLLGTDLSTDRVQTRVQHESTLDWDALESTYGSLAGRAAADLGVALDEPTTRVHRSVDVRLAGQAHELTVDLPDGDWSAQTLESVRAAFGEQYRRTYGITAVGALELVSSRVRVTKVVPKVPLGRQPSGTASPGAIGTRQVWFAEFAGYRPTPVHDRDSLHEVGAQVSGPLIVVDHESTIVVPPGWRAWVDDAFDVVLTAEEANR